MTVADFLSGNQPGQPNPQRRSCHKQEGADGERRSARLHVSLKTTADDNAGKNRRQRAAQNQHLQFFAVHSRQKADGKHCRRHEDQFDERVVKHFRVKLEFVGRKGDAGGENGNAGVGVGNQVENRVQAAGKAESRQDDEDRQYRRPADRFFQRVEEGV